MAIPPAYVYGTTSDQRSGSVVMVWGLDVTLQLASGQIVTNPVVKMYDQSQGELDVSSSTLYGAPQVVANAAGAANMVVIQGVTNLVAGHNYELLVTCNPSPPTWSGQSLSLVLKFEVLE